MCADCVRRSRFWSLEFCRPRTAREQLAWTSGLLKPSDVWFSHERCYKSRLLDAPPNRQRSWCSRPTGDSVLLIGLLSIHIALTATSDSIRVGVGQYLAGNPEWSSSKPATQQDTPSTRVWLNVSSGVYHCPGTKWYGATKSGKYLLEREAVAQRYRAAGGKSCAALSGGNVDSLSTTLVPAPNGASKGSV